MMLVKTRRSSDGDAAQTRVPTAFLIATAASFLETTVPVYTRNLVVHFRGDDEVVEWLERTWIAEELEHGRATASFVRSRWPEIDWDAAYERFYTEYRNYCLVERLQPTRALEMLARCVTESGAATFYKWVASTTREPALAELLSRMYRDEVRHYKHFLRYFRRYELAEDNGQLVVLSTILRRGARARHEDGYIALKHAWEAWYGEGSFEERHWTRFMARVRRRAARTYPWEMFLKMLLQPLELGGPANDRLAKLLEHIARAGVFAA